MTRLTWTDVMDLPTGDPRLEEFSQQVAAEFDTVLSSATYSEFENSEFIGRLIERDYDHFNRYIAGDR